MNEPGNRAQRSQTQSGFSTWFDHHLYSLMASLGRAVRKPWATLLTIGVMAVALSLPLGLGLILSNVERFTGSVEASREISVFLKPDTQLERARSLADELRGRSDIANLAWVTPEEGLAQFRKDSVLGNAVDQLDGNPLPHLYIVTPKGNEVALAEALRAVPEADVVQHDAVWRDRLDQWLSFGRRLAWVLALLLGIGALLVVGNTVRLDIQSRKEEIGVLQLLGATDGFIRRPFLYLGAWYGVAAGLVALGLLTAANHYLSPPLAKLAASYGSRFALQGFNPLQAVLVVIGAGVLGWLGAGLVTGHYLRQTRPDR